MNLSRPSAQNLQSTFCCFFYKLWLFFCKQNRRINISWQSNWSDSLRLKSGTSFWFHSTVKQSGLRNYYLFALHNVIATWRLAPWNRIASMKRKKISFAELSVRKNKWQASCTQRRCTAYSSGPQTTDIFWKGTKRLFVTCCCT